ncbi:MAG: amidoligase family protein [Gammaproteobacteria bacterium]|nr:amidoligase family protein [Gammaproteobacteria bacterium]
MDSESKKNKNNRVALLGGQWSLSVKNNHEGKERRVGVEIEFSGISSDIIVDTLVSTCGGEIEKRSLFDFSIRDSKVGDIGLELDAQILKKAVAPDNDELKQKDLEEDKQSGWKKFGEQLLKFTAEQLVPWEIVSAPLDTEQLEHFNNIIAPLREKGALGTRHAARYAFGVHLNPELPKLDSKTILAYIRSFVVLYDWIYLQEKVDPVRKLTPYIDHFGKDYLELITDSDYSPEIDQLISDYINYNPTRNRSLDCLPLFAYIDNSCVKGLDDEPLIKARPTLHYRLPNCDIDNQEWDLSFPWSLWQLVEQVANNDQLLKKLMSHYREDLSRLTRLLDHKWENKTFELLKDADLL